MYKAGRFVEALKLFEIGMERSPQIPDNYYYAALTYLNGHNYEGGYALLSDIIKKFKSYNKKSVYLFAAIAAKNLNRIEKAIDICESGLQLHERYYDLLLYRAKLYEQERMFEKAHRDFEQVLRIRNDNVEAMLKNAMCLKEIGAISNCLSQLGSALYADKGQFRVDILVERIKILLSENKVK